MFDVDVNVITETLKGLYLLMAKISIPYAILQLAFAGLKHMGSGVDEDFLPLAIRRIALGLFIIILSGTIVGIISSLARTVDVLGSW